MKRRNVEGSAAKLRRATKRSKLNDGCSLFNVLVNFKFLLVWILIIILDFISEFRFELLYPFWIFLCNLSETFRYKGASYLFSYAFITLIIDMFCYHIIPIHWLFFASSTYVWLQFTWYSERGTTLVSILVWISLVSMEAFVRLRELKSLPFQFEICRPFAAHGVGYPILSFGICCKSFIYYQLRLYKKRKVAKENEFYYALLDKAVYPVDNSLISSPSNSNNLKDPLTIDYQEKTSTSLPNLPISATNAINNNETAATNSTSASSSPLRNSISFAQSITINNNNRIVSQMKTTTSAVPSLNSRGNNRNLNNNNYMKIFYVLLSLMSSIPEKLNFKNGSSKKANENVNVLAVKANLNQNQNDHDFNHMSSAKLQSKSEVQNGFVKAKLSNGPVYSKQAVENGKGESNKSQSSKNNVVNDSCMSSVCKIPQNAELKLSTYENKIDEESLKVSTKRKNNDIIMQDSTNVDHPNVAKLSSNVSNSNPKTVSKEIKSNGKKNKAHRNHEDHNYLLDLVKAKDDQIWKVELLNQKLKSDLQTIRQCESDLRKQMDLFKNEEKMFKSSIANYQNDIEHLQKKLQNYLNVKQQDKQTIQRLEKQLDEEKKKFKISSELQAASEKKARLAEENAARATAMAAATRTVCSESCRNKQREYERELVNLRKELQTKDEQIRLNEMLIGEYKDIKNKGSVLMNKLTIVYEKNMQLEESIKMHKMVQVELYSQLQDAKHQFNKQKMICLDYEKEIRNLKEKLFMNSKFNSLVVSNTPGLNLNGFSSSSSPSSSSDIDLLTRCFSSCSPNAAASPSSLSSTTPPLTGQSLIDINGRSLCSNVSSGLNNNGNAPSFLLSSVHDFSLEQCFSSWNPLKHTMSKQQTDLMISSSTSQSNCINKLKTNSGLNINETSINNFDSNLKDGTNTPFDSRFEL